MKQEDLVLTFTFRLSMVVSSNSFPSLKEISEFLKELSVLMLILSLSALIMILGFADPATILDAWGWLVHWDDPEGWNGEGGGRSAFEYAV